MTEATVNEIELNGVVYVRKDQTQVKPNGNRAVVVVDRGWIFAGDVTDENGRIKLARAVHVRGWDAIGFDGLLANPKSEKVRLRALTNTVDLPAEAELFRVPVADTWGL